MIRVGVALSSGGAAGMAQIGALEELISAGIPIDCIAGTSAGAMVGAAWAAGKLDGFRTAMCSLTRRGVVALFDPTWPRTGLLEGRRPLDLIRPYIGETFETLPRPFAAVATDLMTGREVVLRTGSVPDAVRASAAIPGLLTPVTIDGKMLVDGGIVNPIPVDVARELGADVVIAVTVLDVAAETEEKPAESMQEVAAQWLAKLFPTNGTKAIAEAELPGRAERSAAIDDLGLIEIMSRSSRIVQARLAEYRLRSDPPDAMIRIPLPRIALFEFDRSSEAVLAGRHAALAALPAIRAAIERAGSIQGRVTRMLKPLGR
ncbi:MAG: patatin-like phospholipase family protein [Thermoanaerobaculia bacterium]|jgi:NTE family protein